MNQNRFKELLNLYLDHRLSVEEARELEQALRSDPALRRTFRSYAVMQHGCSELFRRSAADAPAPDALVLALRQAEARMKEQPRRRMLSFGWGTWSATAGMAAVVTVIVVRVSQPSLVSVALQERAPVSISEPSEADLREVALAASEGDHPVLIGPRQALPEHLTLAALGISSERSERASLTRWQQSEEEVSRAEAAQSETVAWMPGGSSVAGSEWNRSAVLAAAHFSGRPINAWTGQSGGAQFQNASFTFER